MERKICSFLLARKEEYGTQEKKIKPDSSRLVAVCSLASHDYSSDSSDDVDDYDYNYDDYLDEDYDNYEDDY